MPTLFRVDPASNEVSVFKTKKDATAAGNGPTFSTEEELLALTEVNMPSLVAIHNAETDTPVKKFANRAVAVRRVWALLELKASNAKAAEKAAKDADKPAKAPKVKAEKAPKDPNAPAAQRGRDSRYKGKFLFGTKNVNPRRPGSHGFRSFEVIRESPGIAFDAYIAAGGRANDLAWNVDKGYVEARDTK